MAGVSYFATLLGDLIKESGQTKYRIAKLAGLADSYIFAVLGGRQSPSDAFLRKLSTVKELGVTYEQLLAWKLIDEYGWEPVQRILTEGVALLPSTPIEPPVDAPQASPAKPQTKRKKDPENPQGS